MSNENPTVINNRYQTIRRIGRGGMAEVYLAHDLLLDRDVALKVLFPEHAIDPNFVERFRREAQAVASSACTTGAKPAIPISWPWSLLQVAPWQNTFVNTPN